MSRDLREEVARAISLALHKDDCKWLIYLPEADAILPVIAREVEVTKRETREADIEAIESERLEDPQPGTSDEAYEQALTDAIAAIRGQP